MTRVRDCRTHTSSCAHATTTSIRNTYRSQLAPFLLTAYCCKTETETPLWTLAATVTALVRPQMFTWINAEMMELCVVSVLTLVGMNLDVSDFKQAAQQPKAVATGVGKCTLL
jgi:hypothetical protein